MAEYLNEAEIVEEPVLDSEEVNEVIELEPEIEDSIPEEQVDEDSTKLIAIDPDEEDEKDGEIDWVKVVVEVTGGAMLIWLAKEIIVRRNIKKNAGKPKHRRKKKKMIRRKKNYIEIRIPRMGRKHGKRKKHYESDKKKEEVIDAEVLNEEENSKE